MRRIVDQKDPNGAYLPPDKPVDPPRSEINLDSLIDSHLLLLFRETKALLIESSKGDKLSKDSAHCLRENMKLLMELKKKEKELLETLTDEEISKLIEAKLEQTEKS